RNHCLACGQRTPENAHSPRDDARKTDSTSRPLPPSRIYQWHGKDLAESSRDNREREQQPPRQRKTERKWQNPPAPDFRLPEILLRPSLRGFRSRLRSGCLRPATKWLRRPAGAQSSAESESFRG